MSFRTRLASALAAATLVGVVAQAPAGAVATAPNTAAWSGYATASTLHVNVAQLAVDGPLIADTSVAFSGASVNSQGQASSIINEMGIAVQPTKADRESYGRGAGIEVGLGQSLPSDPDGNQIMLGGLAEAGALPLQPAEGALNPYQTATVTEELIGQSVDPLAYASVLRGQAAATWNDLYTMPMLGSPLGFGLGYADDVQLLNVGDAAPDGTLIAPVIATSTSAASGERTTSQSWSTTYLVNNGDGTCGLASETRQTIAPVRINLPPDADPANDITIEVLGEWRIRAVATGREGSAFEYVPVNGGDSTPAVRIIRGSTVTNVLTFQQLFGGEGLVLPDSLSPLLELAIGEDARAIAAPNTSPDPESTPTVTATNVSGAVDVLRVRLLQPVEGFNALDLRLGHMEARATVPAGGVNCEIPVTKTASPNPAGPGDTLTFTISIPTDAAALIPFPCELTAIQVTDTVSVESGDPTFTVLGGTGPTGQQGTVSGNTVTFADIGSYKPGDPPLTVTVQVAIASDTNPGELRDDVTVVATPGNCTARADAIGDALGGANFVGAAGARLTGGAIEGGGAGEGSLTGTFSLIGPGVARRAAELPKTGPFLPVTAMGGGALVAGAAMWIVRRRAAAG